MPYLLTILTIWELTCPLCHTYLPYLPYGTHWFFIDFYWFLLIFIDFHWFLFIFQRFLMMFHWFLLVFQCFPIMPYSLTILTIWELKCPLCHTYLPYLPYGTHWFFIDFNRFLLIVIDFYWFLIDFYWFLLILLIFLFFNDF